MTPEQHAIMQLRERLAVLEAALQAALERAGILPEAMPPDAVCVAWLTALLARSSAAVDELRVKLRVAMEAAENGPPCSWCSGTGIDDETEVECSFCRGSGSGFDALRRAESKALAERDAAREGETEARRELAELFERIRDAREHLRGLGRALKAFDAHERPVGCARDPEQLPEGWAWAQGERCTAEGVGGLGPVHEVPRAWADPTDGTLELDGASDSVPLAVVRAVLARHDRVTRGGL